MSQGTFTCKTVVDWVELEIQLADRSNFMTVQNALQKALRLPEGAMPYVKALDETNGRSASIFRFRIYDPIRMVKIDQILSELQQRFVFDIPKVAAIEIAFDTYCKGVNVRDLAEIAADRYRFLTASPGKKWYFYRNAGEGRHYIEGLFNHREVVRYFAEGWQLTDQNAKDVDVRYHAYVKTRDDGRPLPLDDYRARLEITLQGAACPCATVEELKQLKFTQLAKHFQYRCFAPDTPPAVKVALAWSKDQLGLKGKYRRGVPHKPGRYSGIREYRRFMDGDRQLNETVYQRLRKMTWSWRSLRT